MTMQHFFLKDISPGQNLNFKSSGICHNLLGYQLKECMMFRLCKLKQLAFAETFRYIIKSIGLDMLSRLSNMLLHDSHFHTTPETPELAHYLGYYYCY